MRVHFHGAAGEVTGSLHEVEADGRRLLLDCGMIQGSPEAERRNFEPFPFEPGALDALIISHAHIDHIGRVPLLVKRGFRGPIYAQAATAALMPVMLLDAASISEGEAERANRHRRKGEPELLPLYTREDVQVAMELVHPLPYDARREIFPVSGSPSARLATSSVRPASSCGRTTATRFPASSCSPATSAPRARRSCAIRPASTAPTWY